MSSRYTTTNTLQVLSEALRRKALGRIGTSRNQSTSKFSSKEGEFSDGACWWRPRVQVRERMHRGTWCARWQGTIAWQVARCEELHGCGGSALEWEEFEKLAGHAVLSQLERAHKHGRNEQGDVGPDKRCERHND